MGVGLVSSLTGQADADHGGATIVDSEEHE